MMLRNERLNDSEAVVIRQAEAVHGVIDFKHWCRTYLRPVLPHGPLACVHGRLYGAGVSIDCVLTVDFPTQRLQALRNAAGHLDSPIARRWYETRQTVVFDPAAPWPHVPQDYVDQFRRDCMGLTVAQGWLDEAACRGSYFSFHRVETVDVDHAVDLLQRLLPVLHRTFDRVVAAELQARRAPFAGWTDLSIREREVAHWVGQGKTNYEISLILGISSHTVKHHVTSVMHKCGIDSRKQLEALLIAHGAKAGQDDLPPVL